MMISRIYNCREGITGLAYKTRELWNKGMGQNRQDWDRDTVIVE